MYGCAEVALYLGGLPGAATCMVALEVALHLGGSPGAATCMVALEVALHLGGSLGAAKCMVALRWWYIWVAHRARPHVRLR